MTLYQKNSPKTIQALFANIAKDYDRANALISFQMHKRWNHALVQAISHPAQVTTLLDLCCGTGEIAFTFLEKSRHTCEVFMLDFCDQMLKCAREKAKRYQFDSHHLHYLRSDAQNIPLPDSSVDAITIAYGIRNVANPAQCLSEARRVLRPGGKMGILELTQPKNWLVRQGHKLYLHTLLPLLGAFITSDKAAYNYLKNSIYSFVSQKQLTHLIEEVGFKNCQMRPFFGGVASLFIAQKP